LAVLVSRPWRDWFNQAAKIEASYQPATIFYCQSKDSIFAQYFGPDISGGLVKKGQDMKHKRRSIEEIIRILR
jgi:hypothetical protein